MFLHIHITSRTYGRFLPVLKNHPTLPFTSQELIQRGLYDLQGLGRAFGKSEIVHGQKGECRGWFRIVYADMANIIVYFDGSPTDTFWSDVVYVLCANSGPGRHSDGLESHGPEEVE
jgi:hypothetical protein